MSEKQTTTVADLVGEYLEHQDTERLARLRHAVLTAETFDPDLDLVRELGPLAAAGRDREVVDLVTAKMPGAALHPTAHLALATALERLGRDQEARRERVLAKVAVLSVLATGDGTRERPWSVLRVADEYDILRSRGLQSRGQSVQSIDGRLVDRHELADGGEVWFVLDRP